MTARQLAARCWRLEPAGALSGENERHFASGADAREAIADMDCATTALAAAEMPAPCWVAQCDGACGEDFEDEEYGGLHAGSRAEMERWLAGAGWVLAGDGRDFCPDDAPDGGGVAAEIEGQQVLPGVA